MQFLLAAYTKTFSRISFEAAELLGNYTDKSGKYGVFRLQKENYVFIIAVATYSENFSINSSQTTELLEVGKIGNLKISIKWFSRTLKRRVCPYNNFSCIF